MDDKIFSKKEAINHGIAMVKKYASHVAVMMVCFMGVQVTSMVLQNFAGQNFVLKSQVQRLYASKVEVDNFYKSLQDQGYIDPNGRVQDKLDQGDFRADPVFSSDPIKISTFLDSYRYRLPFPKFIFYILLVGLWFLTMLLSVGWIKIFLQLSRDQQPSISDLYTNGQFVLPYLLSSICMGLAVMGGLLCLIVPGIILMIAFMFSKYFIIDQGLGPIVAINASRALTKGIRRQLFALMGILFLVNLAGALCLLIGLLFTIPVCGIAEAYVYDIVLKHKQTQAG